MTFIPKTASEVNAKNCDSVTAIGYMPHSELDKLMGNRFLPRRFKERVNAEIQSRLDNDRAELEHGTQ